MIQLIKRGSNDDSQDEGLKKKGGELRKTLSNSLAKDEKIQAGKKRTLKALEKKSAKEQKIPRKGKGEDSAHGSSEIAHSEHSDGLATSMVSSGRGKRKTFLSKRLASNDLDAKKMKTMKFKVVKVEERAKSNT